MIAYYPFNNNANNETGKTDNGTAYNVNFINDNNKNGGYYFNGSNSYIQIPHNSILQPSEAISVAAWIKPKGFYSGDCKGNAILYKGIDDKMGWYGLSYNASGQACTQPGSQHFFSFALKLADNSVESITDNKDIVLDQWYFLVGTYNQNFLKLYINGTLVNQRAVNKKLSTNNPGDLTIGRMNSPVYPYWVNGTIDEVRIYNRSLSDDEIKQLFDKSKS